MNGSQCEGSVDVGGLADRVDRQRVDGSRKLPKASPMEDLFWAAHLTLATLILPRKFILFCGAGGGGIKIL